MEPQTTQGIKTEHANTEELVPHTLDEKKPDISTETEKPVYKYFQCSICLLKEKYEYFGTNPPYTKIYKLLEDSYCIEDPFVPPKQGQFIVLGAHCIKCRNSVCKDTNCSFYFGGTYCIKCAKCHAGTFPEVVREKLNRIAIP